MKSFRFHSLLYVILSVNSLQAQEKPARTDAPYDIRQVTGLAPNLSPEQIEQYINNDLECGQYYYLRSLLRGLQNSSNAQQAYRLLMEKPLEVRKIVAGLILQDEDSWFLPTLPKRGDIGMYALRQDFQPNLVKSVDPELRPEDLATAQSRADYLKRLVDTGVIPPPQLASNIPKDSTHPKVPFKPAPVGLAQADTASHSHTWQVVLAAFVGLLVGVGASHLYLKRKGAIGECGGI